MSLAPGTCPREVLVELTAQGGETAELRGGLERQRPTAELQRGQAERLAERVEDLPADLVGGLRGGRALSVHQPGAQGAGLRETDVRAESLFPEELPETAARGDG
ncbi:hypothetical protein [Streptomyces sp. NPDC005336]|uniref:hypothetical protein n=1 Tax=Streptomyces sp. NPDC005336 TaxID=3157035 RepID=UPI0033ACF0C2